MNNIFIVIAYHYEDYFPYYFSGPEDVSQEDFNILCQSLLNRAGKEAVKFQQMKMDPDYIGMNEVIASLAQILPEYGYHPFNPKQAFFFGPCIIDDNKYSKNFEDAAEIIIKHNDDLKIAIKNY